MQGITLLEIIELIAEQPNLCFRPLKVEQADFRYVDWNEMNAMYELDDMSDDDKKGYLRKYAGQEDLNGIYRPCL